MTSDPTDPPAEEPPPAPGPDIKEPPLPEPPPEPDIPPAPKPPVEEPSASATLNELSVWGLSKRRRPVIIPGGGYL